MPRSSGVRRAYAVVKPLICSANVRAGQPGALQKNRRARSLITTRCPPAAASASRRSYRLCTLDDTIPHRGHVPSAPRARTQMPTRPGSWPTCSTTTPARWGNSSSRPQADPHDKQFPLGDNDTSDSWLAGWRRQPPIYQESLHLLRQHADMDNTDQFRPRHPARDSPARVSCDHEMWVRTSFGPPLTPSTAEPHPSFRFTRAVLHGSADLRACNDRIEGTCSRTDQRMRFVRAWPGQLPSVSYEQNGPSPCSRRGISSELTEAAGLEPDEPVRHHGEGTAQTLLAASECKGQPADPAFLGAGVRSLL
jgi:hypothetical protein